MPIYHPPSNPTYFQQLVMKAHAVLDDVLTKEEREAPELVFGNPYMKQEDRPPRVGWQHVGGVFVVGTSVPTTPTPATPPANPLQAPAPNPVVQLGTRRAIAKIAIFHWSPEQAEHVLDRLWLSCRRGDKDLQRFQWLDPHTSYAYPTEEQGPRLANGAAILYVTLPVDLPVPAKYDGEEPLVTVQGSDLRAGQAGSLGNDPEVTQWQFDRWS